MAKEACVVSQFPSKPQVQVQGENTDHQNHVPSEADNGKEECIRGPKGTSPAFPGWYADESWPGTVTSFQVFLGWFNYLTDLCELTLFFFFFFLSSI